MLQIRTRIALCEICFRQPFGQLLSGLGNSRIALGQLFCESLEVVRPLQEPSTRGEVSLQDLLESLLELAPAEPVARLVPGQEPHGFQTLKGTGEPIGRPVGISLPRRSGCPLPGQS